MSRIDDKAQIITIQDWSQLQKQLDRYNGPAASWAFRGMGQAEWTLQSSLERLDVDQVAEAEAEQYVLTTFQRRAHHYIPDPPAKEDLLEWLALLQHHGAPTRLLDWTKSPYVALFFALDERRETHGNCALWAIDLRWCKDQAIQQISQAIPLAINQDESLGKPETFRDAFFAEPPIQFVAPLQPFRMNERLTIQQGLFLCPGDLCAGFERNLLAFPTDDFLNTVHKIIIPNYLREDILARLNQMNINRASLFPGIDGFAQSLRNNVQIATSRGKFKHSSKVIRLNIYLEYGFL